MGHKEFKERPNFDNKLPICTTSLQQGFTSYIRKCYFRIPSFLKRILHENKNGHNFVIPYRI